MSVKIPNKEGHQAKYEELKGVHNGKETEIGPLEKTREEIISKIKGFNADDDGNDDDIESAITNLQNIKNEVSEFNRQRDVLQNEITANNDELIRLRDSIKFEIDTATTAAKAAAAAAAAAEIAAAKEKAESERKALEEAKNGVKKIIDVLNKELDELRAKSLDDGNMFDALSSTVNEILAAGTADTDADTAAISQATKDMIRQVGQEGETYLKDKKSEFDAIKTQFDKENNDKVGMLEGKIKTLTGLLDESDITKIASTLSAFPAASVDETSNIDSDKNTLVSDVAKKQEEFNQRKGDIDAAIARDKLKFQQDNEMLQKLSDKLDALEVTDEAKLIFKYNNGRKGGIDTDKSPIQAAILYDFNKASKAEQDTNNNLVNSVLMRIDINIRQFDSKINDIENELNKIRSGPQIQVLQDRIRILRKAKDDYRQRHNEMSDRQRHNEMSDRQRHNEMSERKKLILPEISKTGDTVLTSPEKPIGAHSGNPRSLRGVGLASRFASALTQAPASDDSDSEEEKEAADRSSERIAPPEKMKRKYDTTERLLHIPALNDSKDDESIILVELPDDYRSESGSRGGGSGSGGGGNGRYIQSGGAPETLPAGSLIYKFDPKNPKLIPLLASFTAPNKVLHDQELIAALKNGITPEPIEEFDYAKIRKAGLITSEDTDFMSIERRAVYKMSILNLMKLLDSKTPHDRYTHTYMYSEIWMFMNSISCAGIIKALVEKPLEEAAVVTGSDKGMSTRSSSTLSASVKTKFITDNVISKIAGWTPRDPRNPLLDAYFKVFTRCAPPLPESQFLEKVTAKKNKRGIDVNGDKDYTYRFKLNWIILIAFYCHNMDNNTYPLERISELVLNTYTIFLGWMKQDKDTYNQIFSLNLNTPEDRRISIYKDRINKNITKDLQTDITLGKIRAAIAAKLCGETFAKVVGDGDAGDAGDAVSQLPPPDEPGLGNSEKLERIAEIAQGQEPEPAQGQEQVWKTGVRLLPLDLSKLEQPGSARFTRRARNGIDIPNRPQTSRPYTSPYAQTARKPRVNQGEEPFHRRAAGFPYGATSPRHLEANESVKEKKPLPTYKKYELTLPPRPSTAGPRPPSFPRPAQTPRTARTLKNQEGNGRTRHHPKKGHKYTRKFTRIM